MSGYWNVIKAGAKTKTGQKIISALTGGKSKKKSTFIKDKSKKKSTFIKDKSGTITGVKPGSKIGKGRTWEDYIDKSHPSYKENP